MPAATGSSGAGTSPAGQGQAKPSSPSAASGKTVSRTAVGPGVNYSYGVVAVRVTATGGKIVKIGIASLQDGGDPRSQLIDQQALPILEREALQAQSANIQGVSGASYTTAGFVRSSRRHCKPWISDDAAPDPPAGARDGHRHHHRHLPVASRG